MIRKSTTRELEGEEDEGHLPSLRLQCFAVPEALVIDALRIPMGAIEAPTLRIRPDDLAAHVISAAVERSGVDPERIADVYMGAANQAGEDNRDVARMASLLAGLPVEVPGVTVNRLCASGLEAVNQASRAIRLGRAIFTRRRRRVDESCTVGDAETRTPPRRADRLRHHPGLADDQREDGRAPLDRVDGRNRQNVAELRISRVEQDRFASRVTNGR